MFGLYDTPYSTAYLRTMQVTVFFILKNQAVFIYNFVRNLLYMIINYYDKYESVI